MRLALLGVDDEALALVRWAVLRGGCQLVAAYDVGSRSADVAAISPGVVLDDTWESLVLGTQADVVIVARGQAGLAAETGIADDERRAEQLRKLAQAAVPMLVICPACEAIVGFEVEMIRRDSRGVIVPYVPGQQHPLVLELAAATSWGEGSPIGASSPIGKVEQITFEREQADRSRPVVMAQFARDVSILRQLIGVVQSISATGPATVPGRDPLGPMSKELPSLANLSVHLSGDEGLTAHWSIRPALSQEGGRITVIGEKGRVVLNMPASGDWTLDRGDSPVGARPAEPHHEAAEVFSLLSHAASGVRYDENEWLAACRDQEAAEAIDRSLARGRTIELFNEEHTEEESFKGIMAMGGCLLLVGALGVVFVATIVEGLRLPLRDWAAWQYWPIYLLAPIAVFLMLQLLQLVVKKETPDLRRL
ncbi:MAG: hypothetical protein L0211_14085 [Planctomycetaceae bacterium]|nr:hypothetical protein [Planctomycetaceae bacterium]